MIVLDVPMPSRCTVCPCSYYIQGGPHEGKLMCNALEYRDPDEADRPGAFIVAADRPGRPENCPIIGGTGK